MTLAHYHDNDALPVIGGWACYCDHPERPDRPDNWREIRDAYRRSSHSR